MRYYERCRDCDRGASVFFGDRQEWFCAECAIREAERRFDNLPDEDKIELTGGEYFDP